jgi:hydrogenase/urease accessory protein HupE
MNRSSHILRVVRSRILCALFFVSGAGIAFAHDPGLSTLSIRVSPGIMHAVLTFAARDAQQLLDFSSTENVQQANAVRSPLQLKGLLAQELQLAVDGSKATVEGADCRSDDTGNVIVSMRWRAVVTNSIKVSSKFLEMMPLGHRQFLTVQIGESKPLAERMLSADANSATVPIDHCLIAPNRTSFKAFVILGIGHILSGYDHLLFLFGLLLVTDRLLPALKIVTSFTLAHSISLALATMDLLPLPGRLVEPLIAASIVYIGVENLVRGDQLKGRWMLAFAFGLVHGCGFATALHDLGVGMDGRSIIMPLLSFNVGVEIGQMTIASLVLPLLWQLRRKPVFIGRLVPVGSMMVALFGAYWFVERVWL